MFSKRRIYLDYAAGVSANPSSPHREGREAKKTLETARTDIARLVEVQSDDIIFTSGATESNALAILGLLKAGDHALYLPSSHASIAENMKLAATRGVTIEELPIKDYRVDIEALTKMIRPETKLVAMDAVCGETGVVWNTREVAHAIQGAASRPVLHVDASQAPMSEKITRAHFGADMLTFDASKVGAIRGIGALIAHRTIPLVPLYVGGGQERGLRPGSEALELAKEFAASLRAAALGREDFRAHAERARKSLVERIIKAVPNVYINEGSSGERQAPHILNLSLPGRDTDYLVALLDEAGIAVSTRSACETDSEEGSRAVYALTGDRERARATLRVSWGPRTSARDLERFVDELARSVTFIDKGARR
jgi:cysteine desulfurase